MTDMDEIRELLSEYADAVFDRGAASGASNEVYPPNAGETSSRSALLQRVEALREERDAALAAQNRAPSPPETPAPSPVESPGEEGAESKTCERCGYVGGGGWLPGWDTDPTAGTQPRGMKCPDCNPAPAAAESTRAAKVDVEIIRGVEGLCVAVNGTRIAGAKPWGGGKVVESWEVDADDIRGSLPATAPREVEEDQKP